jgi:hypothetical protein
MLSTGPGRAGGRSMSGGGRDVAGVEAAAVGVFDAAWTEDGLDVEPALRIAARGRDPVDVVGGRAARLDRHAFSTVVLPTSSPAGAVRK